MTEKQRIIKAFKDLDFKSLDKLLDNDKSYMDVSKSTFLNAFKNEIEKHKDLKLYDEVEEGICYSCNKGCKAYKFMSQDQPSLNLFFEEEKDAVNDIYLCHNLKLNSEIEKVEDLEWIVYEGDIYFSFYEEEKVNFTESIEYLIKLQRIEGAIEEFNKLIEIGLITVQDVLYWFDKIELLADELNLNDPFQSKNFKATEKIDKLYSEVSNLQHNYSKNQYAKKALIDYNNIKQSDEKSIIVWLLENNNNYFFSLKKTKNWKKTGIIILETEPNLVIDCSDCLESFIFDEIYNVHFTEIMSKYEPTQKHISESGGSITYDLENYLKLHNKYLELFENTSA